MHNLLKNIVLLLSGCLLQQAVPAQRLPFTFDQVRVGDNAISNQVNCLLKDRNGYFWIGTAAGLKRYDAAYTASFRKKKDDSTSLIHNNVQAICEDLAGRIWIATSEGVCFYNRHTNIFTHLPGTKRKGAFCNNIICAGNGDIWFSSVDGVYRYSSKSGNLQQFSPSSPAGSRLSSAWVPAHGLVEDGHKKGIWIACGNGLNFYDYATGKIYNAGFNPAHLKALTTTYATAPVIHKNKLVFADNDAMQIKWYDLQTNTITDSLHPRSSQGYPLFYVLQLFFDRNDNLWISTTDQRAAYVDMKQRTATDIVYESGKKNSFSSDKFTDVLQEQNYTMWFATANGLTTIVGFDAMSTGNKLFETYDLSKQLFDGKYASDYITGLTEDAVNGNWWIATAGNRLIHYDPRTTMFTERKAPSVKECFNYEGVQRIHDYKGKILIFKTKAFYIFDKTTKQFTPVNLPPALADCEKFSIPHTAIAGDSVWVFVESKANEVYCYNLLTKQWVAYPFHVPPTADYLSAGYSCITKTGELLVAVHTKGIAKFSSEKRRFEFIQPGKPFDFSRLYFTGLAEAPDGNILFSNRNELLKMDSRTHEMKSLHEADQVDALAVSRTGHLFYAALDNLVLYNEKANEKISFQFDVQDVFHQARNQLLCLAGGKVISIQQKQLLQIDFREMHLPSFPDQPYISHVFTSDTSILIHENNSRVSFNASQNSFSIDFGLMGRPNASVYEFSYKLEGFDKNWINDTKGKRSATYGNLEGGDYVFTVRAMDINMKTLPDQKLYIHIDTVFYKTKWFVVLVISLIVTAVICFYRFRLNKQKQILQLEKKAFSLEKEKTQVLYESLKQQLNPHFLFNSLSSLRSLIRMNPALATDFLDGLSKTYRYLLRSGDSELVLLSEEINFVQTFIQLQKTRFDEGLQLKIELPEKLMNKQIAPVTIQGLIENAIKHNTIGDDAPLVIEVTGEANDYIVVRNNLQRYRSVETSNKKGLEALKTLYRYLTDKPVLVEEDAKYFSVKIPLI